jgi:hypothetical protein
MVKKDEGGGRSTGYSLTPARRGVVAAVTGSPKPQLGHAASDSRLYFALRYGLAMRSVREAKMRTDRHCPSS